METANIRRAGYPVRFSYLQFVKEFKILLSSLDSSKYGNDVKSQAKFICQNVLGHKDYQFGITKVFLKATHSNILENEKEKILTKSATTIQKNIKAYLIRKRFKELRKAAITIQRYWRGWKPRKDFVLLRAAYMRLQSSIRSRISSHQFKKIRSLFIQFQARSRGYLVRHKGLHKKDTQIQIDTSTKDIDYLITDMFENATKSPLRAEKKISICTSDSKKEIKIQKILSGDVISFKQYAAVNFNSKEGSEFSTKFLEQPLLDLKSPTDQIASLALWITILRFMGDAPDVEDSVSQIYHVSVIEQLNEIISKSSQLSSQFTRAMKALEEEDAKFKSTQMDEGPKNLVNLSLIRRNKLINELHQVHLVGVALRESYDNWLWKKKTTIIEKLHFIIGHGILCPDLRDEIYCQLCKQLSNNPLYPSNINGWILMSLCAGCFMPSSKFAPTLLHFMASNKNKLNCFTKLQRTLLNGVRNQPPSLFELNALLNNQEMVLDIHLIDDSQVIPVEVDAATTANEICTKIFSHVNLKDTFGFSLFIAFQSKLISLESGNCHIMDAVCQCEQYAKEKKIPESKAPWQLLLRKEVFSPWQGLKTKADPVASHLIYYQIMESIRRGQFQSSNERELALLIAQHYYITYGRKLLPEVLTELINELIPAPIIKKKTMAHWGRIISDCFQKSCFYKCKQSDDAVKSDVINFAKTKWALFLSKYYEVTQISGFHLEQTSLLLAVNSEGVFLTKNTADVIMKFSYLDLVYINHEEDLSSGKKERLRITSSEGLTFVFKTQFAEVISSLVNWILDELRKFSNYAIAIDSYIPPNEGFLRLTKGDVIELIGNHNTSNEWSRGRLVKSGDVGEFPSRMVNILPVIHKPSRYILEHYITSLKVQDNIKSKKDILDLGQHTLESYASKNFRNESQQSERQGWIGTAKVKDQAIWKHSKSPLNIPLHHHLYTNPYKMLSMSMFTHILNYMGDKVLDKQRSTISIFEPPFKNEILKDELYCQLMKQLTENPSLVSEGKGWELMWIAVGLFPCSRKLFEELYLFLKTRPKLICQEILIRLEKTLEHGSRKYLPHPFEIEAIQTSTQLSLVIIFPNGMEQVFQADSSMKIKDLIENVGNWLGLKRNNGFGIFMSCNGNLMPLPSDDFVFDAMQEAYLAESKQGPHEILFARKLWLNTVPGEDTIADIVCHYFQEKIKYLSGYQMCSPNDQIELGALIIIAEEENIPENEGGCEKFIENRLKNIIPTPVINKGKNYDWVRRIKHAFWKRTDLSPEQAKLEFLKYIEKWPTFGTAFFDIEEREGIQNLRNISSMYRKDILMGINRDGIIIMNYGTEEIEMRLPLKEILKCSHDGETFSVTTENKIFSWNSRSSHKITDLLNAYLSMYNELINYYR